jgi:Double zinc ribbon
VIAALVVGTVLAVGALAFVLYPIFVVPARDELIPALVPRQTDREAAVAALREIEFDRATGKLSDADYADLKVRYTEEAIVAMRLEETAGVTGPPASDDEIEAAVRAYRAGGCVCPTCGPRPEPDAAFCSNCGRYLRDRCAGCGAPVDALDARYCVSCGTRLAA